MDYFDTILGLIPTSLVAGAAATYLFGDLAITAGATIALLFVLDALFRNPPRDPALGPHQ